LSESIKTPFPNNCQGAVSLSFDDGMRSQLDTAIPMLNEYGLRATFYILPTGTTPYSDDWRSKRAEWREVAQNGHEVGNHSLTHPCSCAFRDTREGRSLQTMTLADIEADVLEAERRLCELTGVERRSFCYPCYDDFVGEGPTRQSYVPVIAKHFVAARGKGTYANHPLTCDLHHLWSFPCERMAGSEMIGLAEEAALQGRWAILTFHGVHEGHLPVADVDLRALCQFLARQRDRLWVAPVVEVAERIAQWRQSQ